MESSRHPRFLRISSGVHVHLTERDRDIIRLVHRHRFLRSTQIVAFVGGSTQPIIRRLHLLYNHGYLERPRSQIDYYHRTGNQSLVYGLGNKGGTLMRQESGGNSSAFSWGEKNRAVARMFLEHALLVSDVMVALELACRQSGSIKFLAETDLVREALFSGKQKTFRWRVKLQHGLTLGVIPDRVFALEFPDDEGEIKRVYFFLEADRGTMPVKRKAFFQTSMYRKYLAYEATWSQSIHEKKFGFNRFRVLTVTTSAARVKSLVAACSRLKRGHGLFLIADRTILEKPEDIFSTLWRTGRPDESTALLS